jgi:hypothetical protein
MDLSNGMKLQANARHKKPHLQRSKKNPDEHLTHANYIKTLYST